MRLPCEHFQKGKTCLYCREKLQEGTLMKCDQCKEDYAELSVTKCSLHLCPLCLDDHRREGCDDCAREAGFEAADYDWDKERGT